MGWTASPPAGPTSTAQATIGSGGSTVVIPASANPLGLQVWSAVISSAVNANAIGSSFAVDDTITDSASNTYLSNEIGLPQSTVPVVGHNTSPPGMQGIIIPAGVSVSVNNGGAGGTVALHRAAATIIYTALAA